MEQTITFETMPKAMAYLIAKVEELERILSEKDTTPVEPVNEWLNVKELSTYIPDHPTTPTIYGWVSKKKIPFHKGGKKLRFNKYDIDKWLSDGKRRSANELFTTTGKALKKTWKKLCFYTLLFPDESFSFSPNNPYLCHCVTTE